MMVEDDVTWRKSLTVKPKFAWFNAPLRIPRNEHAAILSYINSNLPAGYPSTATRIVQHDLRDCGSTGRISYFCEVTPNAL